jgi:CDGSH iron-sulfur domain-containing protein 3
MGKPTIAQKAPYVIDLEPGNYSWCACGKSSNQPFCDGSHKGSEFSPIKITIENKGKKAWCGCKHSANAPFCDGTHKNI